MAIWDPLHFVHVGETSPRQSWGMRRIILDPLDRTETDKASRSWVRDQRRAFPTSALETQDEGAPA